MKVVFLIDWIEEGLSEVDILKNLVDMFPDGKILTLFSTGKLPEEFNSCTVETSFLDKFPAIAQNYKKYLPLYPLAASTLKVPEDTDLVFCCSNFIFKNHPIPQKAKVLSFLEIGVHFSSLSKGMEESPSWTDNLIRKVSAPFFKTWDLNKTNRSDKVFTSTRLGQDEVYSAYNLNSVHIDTAFSVPPKYVTSQKSDYFLLLVDEKNEQEVPLWIDTFNKVGLPLKIAGALKSSSALRLRAKENIRFLGSMGPDVLLKRISEARAFIDMFPKIHPLSLKAIAMGTPVITAKNSASLEYINWNTGVFYEDKNLVSLTNTLKAFCAREFPKEAFAKFSEIHSTQRFQRKVLENIEDLMGPSIN